jgi:hypothetical protein
VKNNLGWRLWLARALIFSVLAWNLQAALAFLLDPAAFAPGFELAGAPGAAAVRGIAVLFVMWNVPYVVAIWQPLRHKMALVEAVAMQFIGLAGEIFIFATLTAEHALLRTSILRFIAFDASGLVLLMLAFLLVRASAAAAPPS